MSAGSVSVAADGTVTKSGLAEAIYDQRVAMLALVEPPGVMPAGAAGVPLKKGLALDANAIATAIFTYLSSNLEAAGTVKLWTTGAAPTGWLLCDGSSYPRTSYAALFAVIGTTFGAVDSTHFNVPDLRGRTAIGAGTGDAADATAHALGSKAGTETHILSTGEMPAHTHGPGSGSAFVSTAPAVSNLASSGTGIDWGTTSATATAGGGGAHNNMQPSLTLNWIIKI